MFCLDDSILKKVEKQGSIDNIKNTRKEKGFLLCELFLGDLLNEISKKNTFDRLMSPEILSFCMFTDRFSLTARYETLT